MTSMKRILCLLFFATYFLLTVNAQTTENKVETTFNELNLTDRQIEALTVARKAIASEMKAKRKKFGKSSEEVKLLAIEQQKKMMLKMEEILNEEQLELHKKNIALLKEQQAPKEDLIENHK